MHYWHTCKRPTGPWMLTAGRVCFVVLVAAYLIGCGPRVVLVSEDSPVRLGPNVKGHVYALVNGEWIESRNRVHVPEGWYAVPPSFVEE